VVIRKINQPQKSASLVSAPVLLQSIRSVFDKIEDHRNGNRTISLTDALMSGLAVFALKCPSLLQFDELKREETIRHNLGTLYGITAAPCDTQLRSILDPIDPVNIEPAFIVLHQAAEKLGLFKQYEYFNGRVLISIDGTGHFSSSDVSCQHCCIKKHRNGVEEHYHQLLGAVVVHPDYRAVIPLAPEPITKGDGQTKNDCERNAAKRLLNRINEQYGHLKPIIIEDGLSSNGPHVKQLMSLEFSFILGVKPGDHVALFNHVNEKMNRGELEEFETVDKAGVIHGYRFINQLPLNDSHPDLLINVLEYWEADGNKVQNFSWITDITLTTDTVEKVMRGGRARWKIENETFNTLKNQGYHLEHNYGHGRQYLASVFGCLTFLAFLIDQLQAWGCCLFQQARQTRRTLKSLWDKMRALFTTYLIASWDVFWRAIAFGHLAAHLEVDTS
jgi:hypothetical protein